MKSQINQQLLLVAVFVVLAVIALIEEEWVLAGVCAVFLTVGLMIIRTLKKDGVDR